MDEKRTSIIGGCFLFGWGCAVNLAPELNYLGICIGILGMIYGFLGPISLNGISFINPFNRRIPLSAAAQKAHDALLDTGFGKYVAKGFEGDKALNFYAESLRERGNLYGIAPPSRISRLIDKNSAGRISGHGEKLTDLVGNTLSHTLMIDQKNLDSFIAEAKKST